MANAMVTGADNTSRKTSRSKRGLGVEGPTRRDNQGRYSVVARQPSRCGRTSATIIALHSSYFGQVSINSHCDDVSQRKHSCPHHESPAASPSQLIEEGKQ